MAYSYGTVHSGGSAITSSCLDDVPFKLGPKFMTPTKVILPPELELSTPWKSTLVNEDYSFEVEEAVLKWSAERERQFVEQQRQAAEKEATLRRSQDTDSSGSGSEMPEGGPQPQPRPQPIYQNVSSDPNYENPGILRPKPAPRSNPPKSVNGVSNPSYSEVTVPNPLVANISNDILQPTPISSNAAGGQNLKRSESREKKKDFDMTWFEKEDDPFDNLELQTINDMEELATVLEETKKTSPVMGNVNNSGASDLSQAQLENNVDNDGAATSGEADADLPLYENVESKGTNDISEPPTAGVTPVFDMNKLPPIPPRRDLVGKSPPLPPIGRISVDSALDQLSQGQNFPNMSEVSSSLSCDNTSVSSSFPKYENSKSISPKPPVPKPPRTFKYSRYDMEEEAEDLSNPSNGDINVQSKPIISDPDLNASGERMNFSEELNFVNHHFGASGQKQEDAKSRPVPAPRRVPSPPSRPSSQQSWNRYNPLPAPVPSAGEPVIFSPPDPYDKLSSEARTSVDSLLTMGFPKDRVIRAVEKLGEDQKEVVEYLCLVDQLTEKGFSIHLAENALLLFQNSMKEASKYLELFQQFEELGFHGDRIKEALVNTKNDREKSLDILTASS